MEDRQLIREEIGRLKGELVLGACSSQTAMETACKSEAYDEVLAFIDKLDGENRPEPARRYGVMLHYAELANGAQLSEKRTRMNTEIRMMVAKRMRQEGYTFREIGKLTGRDHSTASYWVRAFDDIMLLPYIFRDFLRRWERFNEMLDNDGQ